MTQRVFLQSLVCLCVGLFLFSCKKNSSDPTTPPPPGIDSLKVNLTFNTSHNYIYELMISEPGGKLLLDTIVPGDVYLRASLPTKEKLVDVTIVYPGNAPYITTVKSVDPSKWVTPYGSFYRLTPEAPSTTPANIVYINAPDGYNRNAVPVFSNSLDGAGYGMQFNAPSTVSVNYQQFNGNYTYLLFPLLALYNLHMPAGVNETVDLSHMDTAQQINFRLNDGFFTQTVALNAVFDTTDDTHDMAFYPRTIKINPGPDLVCPPIGAVPVQKYELDVEGGDSAGNFMGYYSYDRTLPTDLRISDDYTLVSREKENFTVKFNGPAPTMYSTTWTNAEINWYITAPSDSTTIHPLTIPVSRGSKLFHGDFSSMKNIDFTRVNAGDFNYSGYFDYTCDPVAIKSGKLRYYAYYSRGLYQ